MQGNKCPLLCVTDQSRNLIAIPAPGGANSEDVGVQHAGRPRKICEREECRRQAKRARYAGAKETKRVSL